MLNDYGKTSMGLANTGIAGITIGGLYFQAWWLVAIACLLILAGIVALRFGFRRGKTAGQA